MDVKSLSITPKKDKTTIILSVIYNGSFVDAIYRLSKSKRLIYLLAKTLVSECSLVVSVLVLEILVELVESDYFPALQNL